MWVPAWLDWYKKPEYRDIKEYSNAIVSGKRPASPDGRGRASVPARLRLERVLDNKTCQYICSQTPPTDTNTYRQPHVPL